MTDSPLVSVIINCYNSEKYLGETIDSLLSQTYGNWEAIFWDNCSTDRTADIIKGYGDIRFRYFMADKNTSLGEARNLALKKVKGELLCFLDSDDVWMKDFLEVGVRLIREDEKLAGFYSNYNNWRDNNIIENNLGRECGRHDYKYILKNYGIGMSACLVRSNIVKENNICFDNSFSLVEDYDFFLSILRFGDFVYSPLPLYNYRITEGNTSHRSKKNWVDEYHKLYEKILNRDMESETLDLRKLDLERIKYFEIFYQLEDYIERNDRGGMLWYFLRKKIPARLWSRALFLFMGRDLFNKMRNYK